MKKLLITITILLILSSLVFAKLSDETLELVNSLKWKHSFGTLICVDSDNILYYDSDFDYEWWSYYFEDGKFFVETQDGKWFIEMQEMEKMEE